MQERSLASLFRRVGRVHADAPAFIYVDNLEKIEGFERWTFGEFVHCVSVLCRALETWNVGTDGSVGLLVPNTPMGQCALFASEISACALPLNPLLSDHHLAELMKSAQTRVLIAASGRERLERLRSMVPGLAKVILLEELESLCRSENAGACDLPERNPEKPVAVFHTGGTTGAPKLVQHLQANQLATAAGVCQRTALGPDDMVINALPLFHVAGPLCIGLSAISAGACQLLCSELGARDPMFANTLPVVSELFGATVIGGVPTTIGVLASRFPSTANHSIRLVITGGAALPQAIETQVLETMKVDLTVIYGMTESAGLIAAGNASNAPTRGWLGAAAPGVDIRILKLDAADSSQICGPGVPGLVVVRGDTVGPGYIDPEKNRELFTQDGWLKTGDIGLLDEEGHLKLTGRAKDLIIRSGHNIDPALIEDAAMQFPGIAFAAAVAAPDAYAGEVPVLFVQLDQGLSLDESALIDFLSQRLEPPAKPRWIKVLERLPMTAVGKIYKPELASQAIKRTVRATLHEKGLGQASIDARDINGQTHLTIEDDEIHRSALTSALAVFNLDWTFKPSS